MSRAFRLSTRAKADLREITSYIADDSVEHAEKTLERLYDAFRQVATDPGIGRRRPDLSRADLKFWTVEAWIVVYRGAKPVEVGTVPVT